MTIQPYLFFNGRCDEAAAFYQEALGAEIQFRMTNAESPDQSMVQPGTEGKVMHMALRIGDSLLLASDGRCTGETAFEGFALSITPASAEEAKRIFAALSDGGEVQMPMTQTFFSPAFGMVADKFGIGWMVYVNP